MATIGSVTATLAAAHGLTAGVMQTWYPGLVRTPRVMVPIQLEVLIVRNTQQQWANCQMQTPAAAGGSGNTPANAPAKPADTLERTAAQRAADLLPAPFTMRTQPRTRGAYLQWYLPRGLTSGSADPGANTARFPAVPDRWLVLRISQGSTRYRRSVTGWVLDAGVEPPVVTPLANWVEPGPATGMQNPLTALGHGDLSWAGYFDNVENRLGFHDAWLDTDKVVGPLSYLVCGWYADPTLDPLGAASVNSLSAFNTAMQNLGWQLDAGQLDEVLSRRRWFLNVVNQVGLPTLDDAPDAAYTTSGNWWPGATILHGAVVGIDWPGNADTVEVGGPPDPATIQVAVGDTMAQAFGALIAQANGDASQAPIVEALQAGVLAELDQPDGRARLDVQLHTTSFAGQPGGTPATEPVTIAPSGPPPVAPQNPSAPPPGVFAQTNSLGDRFSVSRLGQLATGHFLDPRALGEMTVQSGRPVLSSSQTFREGGLASIIGLLNAGAAAPAADPGGTFDAMRAAPRLFTARDPCVLVQGGKRAFTHDSSVQTENGMVVCRLTPVYELSWTMPDGPERYFVRGEDVLESGVNSGSVPLECDGLLQETVLLDSGSAATIAANVAQRRPGAFDVATATLHARVEQTAWYALRNPHFDGAPLLAHSGIAGTLPMAFALAPAARPWTPICLEWSVEFLPSPRGENDWTLTEIDFVLNDSAVVPKPGTGIVCSGRSTVTGGAGNTLASAVQKALDSVTRIGGTAPVPASGIEAHFSELAQTLSTSLRFLNLAGLEVSPEVSTAVSADKGENQPVDPSLLSDIGTALSQIDVLSCGLNGIQTQLRGGVPGDGSSRSASGVTPTPFFAIRSGLLRLVRLRLVDGFGQFVDLCGSSATSTAHNYLVSSTMSVSNEPGLLAQPPRFTAPTRMWFRYMSADQPGVEADYQTSPLCGFLLPNHLDGSLEFVNADGSGAGSLQPNDQGLTSWEGAPGLPGAAGQDPAAALGNSHAAQLANALLDWGIADLTQPRESALSALLRCIDSTLWTVDPFGHQGDEHLSLLLGHPICIMRALLRLDVIDPVVTADGTFATVPIRLGSLTQWDDGLLGYFVNDDYTRLYVADATAAGMARPVGAQQGFLQQINLVAAYYASFANDVAGNVNSTTPEPGQTPVTHPFVDTSGILWIRPNQTMNLTLLVEPLNTVHATTGLVPRKEIGMRRTWINSGLAALAPTLRFGPVLVDPATVRMPLATDISGTWVWDYRSDAVQWKENAVTNATDGALPRTDPPQASEGWLKLVPPRQASS